MSPTIPQPTPSRRWLIRASATAALLAAAAWLFAIVSTVGWRGGLDRLGSDELFQLTLYRGRVWLCLFRLTSFDDGDDAAREARQEFLTADMTRDPFDPQWWDPRGTMTTPAWFDAIGLVAPGLRRIPRFPPRQIPVWCDVSEIQCPLAIPFALAAVPTGLLMLRQRRSRRPGCCAACGYDLTGNLSGRCPECGLPIAVGHV